MLKTVILPAILVGVIGCSTVVSEARPSQLSPQSSARNSSSNIPGKFDFYVLDLSWSPDYCATNGKPDPQQCAKGRQLGFVLHGLWPQYNRGWPANCSNEAFDPSMKQRFPNLYPSASLYTHEWAKHGTCSGLSQPAFHQLAADLKTSLRLPDRYQKPAQPFRATLTSLRQDFVKANPGFSPNGIAATCSSSGRFLQEVMVCYGQNGKPGQCSAEILKKSQTSCGQPNFLVRSVR